MAQDCVFNKQKNQGVWIKGPAATPGEANAEYFSSSLFFSLGTFACRWCWKNSSWFSHQSSSRKEHTWPYLLIGGQGSEEGNDVTFYIIQLQDFGKFSEFGRGSTAHHRSVVWAQGAKMPEKESQRFNYRQCNLSNKHVQSIQEIFFHIIVNFKIPDVCRASHTQCSASQTRWLTVGSRPWRCWRHVDSRRWTGRRLTCGR